MASAFERLKKLLEGPFVANTPPELSQCEFECVSENALIQK